MTPFVPTRQAALWVIATTIALCLGYYARILPDLAPSGGGLVFDDARHFVVWLRRLGDAGLFPNDPIADYFEALTPIFYRALYLPAVALSVDPLIWHLVVVSPLVTLLAVWSIWLFVGLFTGNTWQRALLFGLFVLSLYLHERADLMQGLPRSFCIATLFLTIYAFVAKRRLLLVLAMFFGANLYPTSAMVAGTTIAVMALFGMLAERRIDRNGLVLVAMAGVASLAGAALFELTSSTTGEEFNLAQARSLAIFQPGGRTSFFASPDKQFLCGARNGLLPVCPGGNIWSGAAQTLGLLGIGYVVIRLLARRASAKGDTLSETGTSVFFAMLVSGIVWFAIAHAIAFELHLPTRYSNATIGVLYCFSAALLLGWLGPWVLRRLSFGRIGSDMIFGLSALATFPVVAAAIYSDRTGYYDNKAPELSSAIAEMPKDATIAGFSSVINSVPAFASRSVFVSLELLVPYKRDYYMRMADRVAAQTRLFAGPVDADWHTLLSETGIDAFVIGTSDADFDYWFQSFPETAAARGETVFATHLDAVSDCRLASDGNLQLVDSNCFAAALPED